MAENKPLVKASEAEAEKRKPLFLRIPSWTVIAITGLLGIGYGIIYAHLIAGSKKCAPAASFVGPFEPSFLKCLEINEIGDALGGAFGPLAFLFLAAALLIQAMELSAQRWELDETQTVMREQVQEMKASTALLKEQTEVLKKEQQQREQQLTDQAFIQLEATINAYIKEQSALTINYTYAVEVDAPERGLLAGIATDHFEILSNTKKFDLFYGATGRGVVSNVRGARKQLATFHDEEVQITQNSWELFSRLRKDVDFLIAYGPHLSLHQSIRVESGNFAKLHTELELLMEEMKRFSDAF